MKKINWDLDSDVLHILAMTFMLMDHMWASFLLRQAWLTCLGRIAFPIFAFMLVEGYFHTRNLKKYMLRMLLFAVISELPFNLLYGGVWIYPYHQNVMWTLLIGLVTIWVMEKIRAKGKLWLTIPGCALAVVAGELLSILLMTDFNQAGMLMISIFYFFRGRKWWCFLGQLVCMYWINVEVMGGMCYIVNLFGHSVELVQQGFALLALIPIWLYRGRKGNLGKGFQYFCYAFYPAHCLILAIIQML